MYISHLARHQVEPHTEITDTHSFPHMLKILFSCLVYEGRKCHFVPELGYVY